MLACLDPTGCEQHQAKRLHRRTYFAKGPNYLWHFDGFDDKQTPFGLCISGRIDGFTRHLIWLNVYYTNSDPSLIGGYYIEAIKSLQGCPVFLRGDPGIKNVHVKCF